MDVEYIIERVFIVEKIMMKKYICSLMIIKVILWDNRNICTVYCMFGKVLWFYVYLIILL